MTNATKIIEKQKEESLKRQKGIIIDELYPILIEEEMTIEDAKLYLQVVNMSIKQAFENLKTKMYIKELGLSDMLAEGDKKERYLKILAILEQEHIAQGCGMVEELEQALNVFQKQENMKRLVKDLTTDWIR
jgi:hypothetical protein